MSTPAINIRCRSCRQVGVHQPDCPDAYTMPAVAYYMPDSDLLSHVAMPQGFIANRSTQPHCFMSAELAPFESGRLLRRINAFFTWDERPVDDRNYTAPRLNSTPTSQGCNVNELTPPTQTPVGSGPPRQPSSTSTQPIEQPQVTTQPPYSREPSAPPTQQPFSFSTNQRPPGPQRFHGNQPPLRASAPRFPAQSFQSPPPRPQGYSYQQQPFQQTRPAFEDTWHAGPPPSMPPAPPRQDFSALQDAITTAFQTIAANSQNTSEIALTPRLLQDLPCFDGKPENFGIWRDKLQLAAQYLPDHDKLQLLRSKLANAPSDYLAGHDTTDLDYEKTLELLSRKYDLFKNPLYTANRITALKQGHRSIADFHAELAAMLRGASRTFQSTDPLLKSAYVNALSSLAVKRRIFSFQHDLSDDQQSKVTLAQLMKIAQKEEFCDQMIAVGKPTPPAAPAVVQAAPAVAINTSQSTDDLDEACLPDDPPEYVAEVAHLRAKYGLPQKQGSKRPWQPNGQASSVRPNPANTGARRWCLIHETPRHATEECRLRDVTTCPYCQGNIQQGQFAAHIAGNKCTAKRCFNCNRLGHFANRCRAPKRTRTAASSDQSSHPNHVSAQSAPPAPAPTSTALPASVKTEPSVTVDEPIKTDTMTTQTDGDGSA